jgi:hypothetical protein
MMRDFVGLVAKEELYHQKDNHGDDRPTTTEAILKSINSYPR